MAAERCGIVKTPRVPPPDWGAEPPADFALQGPLGQQPELWAAFQRLYGTLWSRGVLDQPTKEVARLRNARVTDCRICRSLRFAGAREQGLSEELVEQIDDGYADSALSDRHKAVIRWADAFLTDPASIDPAIRAEIDRHLDPAQLVELTAGLALFMGFSKIAVVLGAMPDELPVMVVPTPS